MSLCALTFYLPSSSKCNCLQSEFYSNIILWYDIHIIRIVKSNTFYAMRHVTVKLCSEASGTAVKSSFSVTLNLDCVSTILVGGPKFKAFMCICVSILSGPLGTSDILTEYSLQSTNCCQG